MPLRLLQSPPRPPPSFLLVPPRHPAFLTPQTLTPRPIRLRNRLASLPITDDELLRAITAPAGADTAGARLPAVRSYDSDLANLTLIGVVGFEQAVTAAAADGGGAAEEHLSSGTPTMVVETVFPGGTDERSTVSTRLFLPAKMVMKKAKKLRSSLTSDILSGNPTVSKNILAMTFRQVILQKVWSFKLTVFCPGAERKMEDLASPREASDDFVVSSSDVRLLSALAEAVCFSVLESTERRHFGKTNGSPLRDMFSWLQKPQGNCSLDSSICVYKIAEQEIEKNAMSLANKISLSQEKSSYNDKKLSHRWWVAPNYSRLEKTGGPELISWTNEFIPAYRLQMNADIFKDAKLEGWRKIADNRWEVLLTHYQMVELANVLDMYYEDRYTLPDKQLSCSLITESLNVRMKKSFPWKALIVTFAGACVFIFISILAQVRRQHLLEVKTYSERINLGSLTGIDAYHIQSNDMPEVGTSCISVVKMIKDTFGWPGDVQFDAEVGGWTGALPRYLLGGDPSHLAIVGDQQHTKNLDDGVIQSEVEQSNNLVSLSGTNHVEHPFVKESSHIDTVGMNIVDATTTAQDIASFQVVLSGSGKIIGFQPTNRVALNHWASNPLAKLLYGQRKLTPGLFEPSLKVPPLPREVIILELVMSVNPESSFALARPIRITH